MPEQQTLPATSAQADTKSNRLIIGLAVAVVAMLIILGILVFASMNNQNQNPAIAQQDTDSDTQATADASNEEAEDAMFAPIKHIGIDLDYYDPETGRAGDIVFTTAQLGEFDMPYFDYGFIVPASSARPNPTANPQPTFIVPLGTKVRSLVDGTVVSVPKLYSNDYSIHIQAAGSDLIFETEHVINVEVEVGDIVTAGQVIAEVSDYDARNYSGYGLYEIGILQGGNPPSHLCPFLYLDPSIKQETYDKLNAFYKAWNEFRGEQVYDEELEVPGCITLEEVPG